MCSVALRGRMRQGGAFQGVSIISCDEADGASTNPPDPMGSASGDGGKVGSATKWPADMRGGRTASAATRGRMARSPEGPLRQRGSFHMSERSACTDFP